MTQRQTGFLIALLARAFALSLDLWTKAWAWEHLKPASPGQPDNPVTVIEGPVSYTHLTLPTICSV